MKQVTLVTGGSRGIGAATVKLCAEAGHAVAINYLRNEQKAQTIADKIMDSGGNAITIKADTGVEADVERMFKKVSSELGTITGLVNNAGIHGPRGRLDRLSDDEILYAASKGTVNSLTIGLSQEVAREGIRVNTVAPGLTETEMPSIDVLKHLGPKIPSGRAGQPEEIGKSILWLLSDAASYVNGANLRVSGGRI